MDTVSNLLASWLGLITKAFTEHTLVAAVVTIAAVGVFVVLQQEIRPYRLATNVAVIALAWLVSVSGLAPVMAALRRAWSAFEVALPVAAKLFAYFYGICERHPIMAVVIVGVGTTAYFLKQPWPTLVSWGPVRAASAVFVVALSIHIAGPIADLLADEPLSAAATALGRPVEKFADVPAHVAVARAIQAGDQRYVSVPQCVDEVSGYPVSGSGEKEIASPWTIGVKGLGATCYESLGHEGDVRMRRQHEYATEYNRLMYEHNKTPEHQAEQLKRPVPVRVGGIL